MSILIAEDDESSLSFLTTLLRKAKFSILFASNGKEAVDFCIGHPEIGLVFMDIRMPLMDGMEATRKIKTFRKDLPIIAVTAFSFKGAEKVAREAGCDDYLAKPITKSLLFEKIGQFTGFNSKVHI
jgi:CheY-like chemotaxis protein